MLQEKYTDKRPEVVQARQALTVARRSLEAEITRQTRSLETGASPYVHDDLVSALAGQARIDGLRRAVAAIDGRTTALPAAETHYEQLKLTLTDARARLSLVRAEYAKAQIIAQSRPKQFVVLDPASKPDRSNQYTTQQCAVFGALICGLLVLIVTIGRWVQTFVRKLGL